MTPSSTPRPRSRTRNALLFIGALLFLVEEWLWVHALRFFAWLDRRPAMRWIDRRLAALPAVVALVVLCVPIVLLFPFKIFGLWLMGTGRFFTGCLVMLVAKVVSTGIVARIFLACRPRLMEMPWFARLSAWLLLARDRIHAWLATHPGWHAAKRTVRRMRATIWSWLNRDATGGRRGVLSRWRLHRRARHRRDFAARQQR